MTWFRSSVLFSVLCVSLYHTTASAAAFQLYEVGTPIIGTAAVGQAVTNDASSAYFNPASMTLLPDTQFMLGSQMLVPYFNFQKNKSTTIIGNNGGNAGNLIPGMGLYFATSLSPKLKVGASLNSPFGGAMAYEDGWVGRFYVQNVLFYTINLNPSFAWQITDWAAFGAGFSLEYLNLQEKVALPIPIPGFRILSGQVKVSLANIAPGFNAGMLFTPYPSARIGIAYRSQIVHHLSGSSTFFVLASNPTTHTKLVDPAEVIVSGSQNLGDKFTLLAEGGWANWSTMTASILTVRGFSAAIPQNWHNTWRAGLGGKFKALCNLTMQLGASYDSSPTSTGKRLPDLPMDKQLRIGGGVIYNIIKPVAVSVSYEYINFGRAPIQNTTSNGVISGYYSRNYADVLQIGLNVDI